MLKNPEVHNCENRSILGVLNNLKVLRLLSKTVIKAEALKSQCQGRMS